MKVIKWLLAAGLYTVGLPAFATTCLIYDMASLQGCLNQGSSVTTYYFQSNMSCTGGNCCAAGGALIDLSGRSGVTIQGNGYIVKRESNQTSCPAISVQNASNISINSLQIDEDSSDPRCLPANNCPATIDIRSSSNVAVDSVGVFHAKAFGIASNSTYGFSMNNSVVSNTGIIGVYVGNGTASGLSSSNVSITNSTISHSGANGIAFQGVDEGTTSADNAIINNVLDTNHYAGVYVTPSFTPYFNNGGQIYVPKARWVLIENNIIADGRCDNCRGYGPNGNVSGGGISAFEFGYDAPFDYIRLHANKIRNMFGAVFFSDNSIFNGSNSIWDNDARGATQWTYNHGGSWNPTNGYNANGNYTPTANSSGYLSATIYRLYSAGFHQEANWVGQHGPGAIHENTFNLATYPLPGASKTPIYRCLVWTSTSNDFPSHDSNCEGFYLQGILGFSYPAGHPGSQPFYRCLVNSASSDHFVSWDPYCEGQTSEGLLGYAIP